MTRSEIPQQSAEVRIRPEGPDTVIELHGRLDSSLGPQQQEQVLGVAKPGCRLVLDFSASSGVSALGIRMLLLFVRHVQAIGGVVSARNIAAEWQDVAEAAGFAALFGQAPALVKRPVLSPLARLTVDAYPTHYHGQFALRPGVPLPFGATPVARGVNFSIFSRHATGCTLVLFRPGAREPYAEIPFPPGFRIGDVFAMIVFDLDMESIEYGFRVDGPFDAERGHRFDRTRVLLDPTARSVCGSATWGVAPAASQPYPYRAQIVREDFDWEEDRPLGRPIESLVIYELHVRGFTRDPSSGVKHPGTFAGLRQKIPYLKALGINCVELLPVFEFDEMENPRTNPRTGERLWNYWGYSTVGFYAPNASYAATGRLGMQVDEFKYMIKELHRAGIEVILDVVFNHTAEGDERGPTISFRGLDNRTYYMLTPHGHYYNFSGCGNTLNCNQPAVRGFVIDCLRYWVAEYHIDGFRFDLASILGRDPNGVPLANPPLLESLAGDPVLGQTKLIAEAWDAGGLYQVGTFPEYGRWAEWNGRYRDCVRKFLKGDSGQVGEMATRLMGSPDLYEERARAASINFVTCHDGFTLADLVSYNAKHNEDNGEDNRDGANDNCSWNCGTEGPTSDPAVNALRGRQIKNALTILLLSRGVPMLLMGDECGRTQQGNNNAYCHDGPLNWFDWGLVEKHAELFRYCRLMIQFRHKQAQLLGPLGEMEVSWHGTRAWQADWSPDSRILAWMRRASSGANADAVYTAMNMHWESQRFELPAPPDDRRWHVVANTSMPTPEDIWESGQEPPLSDPQQIWAGGRSIIVLRAQ